MSDNQSHTQVDALTAYRAGDEAAVASVYDRCANGIFSYFLARTADEELSSRATARTFARAADPENDPKKFADLKTWLFLNARAVAREEDMGFTVPSDAGDDLRTLALTAVSGLGVRDRDLMALQATGNLGEDELFAVAGLDPVHADEVITKTRRRVEGALGPLLIARFGTDECEDLAGIAGPWDGSFSSGKRAAVNRHVTDCEICRGNRSALVAAGGVMPQLLTVAAPAAIRARVLDDLVTPEPEPDPEPAAEPEPETEAAEPVPPPAPIAPDPSAETFPASTPVDRDSNDLVMLGVFVILAILLGLIGFAVVDRFEPLGVPQSSVPNSSPPEGAAATTTTTTRAQTTTTRGSDTSSTTTQTVAASPAAFEVSAGTVDFGSDAITGQFDITNTGGQPGQVTLESSSTALVLGAGQVEVAAGETTSFDVNLDRGQVTEGDFSETITLTWEGGQLDVAAVGTHEDNPIIHNPVASPSSVAVSGASCSNTQTTVSARIRDTSSFEAVVRWSADGGGTTETAMADVGGEIYEAVIGPFTVEQTAEARVVAIDELGNAGGASVSIDVTACP